METQIWYPPVRSVLGGLRKGTVALVSTLLWEKASPSALTWCLLNCCPGAGAQSEWVWVSLCEGPLRGTPGTPEGLFSLSHNPRWSLQLEVWWLLFLALEPRAGAPVVGLKSLDPQGKLHSQDIHLNFIYHMWCSIRLFSLSTPRTSLDVASSYT